MNVKWLTRLIAIGLFLLAMVVPPAAAQGVGTIEGNVSDSGGGLLPGVLVELTRAGASASVASTTTDAQGAYRFQSLRPGNYLVRLSLAGFSPAEVSVKVEPSATVSVPVALEIQRMSETVRVVASEMKLDATTSTQSTTFSNQMLNELPTASRNYTHVIVSEAGVRTSRRIQVRRAMMPRSR